MRKILSFIATVALMLSLTGTAFASEEIPEGASSEVQNASGEIAPVYSEPDEDCFTWVQTANGAALTGYSGDAPYILIPDTIAGEPVTEILHGFADEAEIKGVVIPDSVETIGEMAFFNCTTIEEISLGENVTLIDEAAFMGCLSLSSVTTDDSLAVIGSNAFRSCRSLAVIDIPDSVTTIGSGAFYGSGLVTVSVPGSVGTIAPRAFACCEALTEVVLETGVQCISDEAFFDDDSLAEVTVPSSVEELGDNVFNGCGEFIVHTSSAIVRSALGDMDIIFV